MLHDCALQIGSCWDTRVQALNEQNAEISELEPTSSGAWHKVYEMIELFIFSSQARAEIMEAHPIYTDLNSNTTIQVQFLYGGKLNIHIVS